MQTHNLLTSVRKGLTRLLWTSLQFVLLVGLTAPSVLGVMHLPESGASSEACASHSCGCAPGGCAEVCCCAPKLPEPPPVKDSCCSTLEKQTDVDQQQVNQSPDKRGDSAPQGLSLADWLTCRGGSRSLFLSIGWKVESSSRNAEIPASLRQGELDELPVDLVVERNVPPATPPPRQ